MTLTVNVEDIDYASLAALLIPMVAGSSGGALLDRMGLLTPEKAASVLNMLPQEKKDAMLAAYINKNSDKAAELIMKLAGDKGYKLRVTGVKAAT